MANHSHFCCSHFKKDKVYVFGHVNCNVALIKGKDVATLKGSFGTNCHVSDFPIGEIDCANEYQQREFSAPPIPPQSPCWYPLSWRNNFPRAFSHEEIETLTNGFSEVHTLRDEDDMRVYQGLLQEAPILVKCFKETGNKIFWSMLKILSQIRHRNITNLVGYCSTGDIVSLLFDYPCNGTVAMNLRSKRDLLLVISSSYND